jgi:hypothetical protein
MRSIWKRNNMPRLGVYGFEGLYKRVERRRRILLSGYGTKD